MKTQMRSMPMRSANAMSWSIRSSGVRPGTPDRWQCKSQIIRRDSRGKRKGAQAKSKTDPPMSLTRTSSDVYIFAASGFPEVVGDPGSDEGRPGKTIGATVSARFEKKAQAAAEIGQFFFSSKSP